MSEIKVERATPERLAELGADNWSPWNCGVETFDWTYSERETAHVLEGKVRVVTEHGQDVTFGAGDIVVFPAGLSCTWTVIEPIRKVFSFG